VASKKANSKQTKHNKMKNIKTIAFDADDTLWVNEPYFQETERKFAELLKNYFPKETISKELFEIEMKNLSVYGYGIKGFMLSMIETITKISDNKANIELVDKTLQLGHELLNRPVELLDGVENVLKRLNGKYRLVLATKGDLLDQERKLVKSGLEKYFHHIEVMSEKKEGDYKKLLKHFDCKAENFLMIGNSLKSDIIPVLDLGAKAVYVPFHTTWTHEKVDNDINNPNFSEVKNISEIIKIL